MGVGHTSSELRECDGDLLRLLVRRQVESQLGSAMQAPVDLQHEGGTQPMHSWAGALRSYAIVNIVRQ